MYIWNVPSQPASKIYRYFSLTIVWNRTKFTEWLFFLWISESAKFTKNRNHIQYLKCLRSGTFEISKNNNTEEEPVHNNLDRPGKLTLSNTKWLLNATNKIHMHNKYDITSRALNVNSCQRRFMSHSDIWSWPYSDG